MACVSAVWVCHHILTYVLTATTSSVYSAPGFSPVKVRACSLMLTSVTLSAAAPGRTSRSTTAADMIRGGCQ